MHTTMPLHSGVRAERGGGGRAPCGPLRNRCGIAGELVPTRVKRASLTHTAAEDIDRAWPGPPYADTLHRGRIAVAAVPSSMRAGVQETIDVYVTNESEETWRWGKEARPEIRLGYRWSLDGKRVHEPMALRTPLPADLRPGETQFVPVHVVPPSQAGRYALQLELVHEGFGCFGSTAKVAVEVRERAAASRSSARRRPSCERWQVSR